MRRRITQHVQGGGGHTTKKWRITKKGDALQKTGSRNHKQEQLLSPSSWNWHLRYNESDIGISHGEIIYKVLHWIDIVK